MTCQNPGVDRAVGSVGARQVTGAHQEFIDDLWAGKLESSFEEARPVFQGQRVMPIKPGSETAMFGLQGLDHCRIVNHGIDLAAVADDPGVFEQTLPVGFAVGCDLGDMEIIEGGTERSAFLEDCQPGEASLVDLESQAFEERIIVSHGKPVLMIVVGFVKGMVDRLVAVVGHSGPSVMSGAGASHTQGGLGMDSPARRQSRI